MPTFCRHNRFVARCPICSRESQAAAPAASPRPATPRAPSTGARSAPKRARTTGLRVRRLPRGADDGYRSGLVPGIKSSEDARRLADELAFAAGRLARLAADPPGLYAEVASAPDAEEALWLAFLIAYVGPAEEDDPFAGIRAARVSWSSGELPNLEGVAPGPRGAHVAGTSSRTAAAYRAWAERHGSQAEAFAGDPGWGAERRFARIFERLALPSFGRAARFDLLVTLGSLGAVELRAPQLQLGGSDPVTVAAKRAFGIGDSLLLERRAAELAAAVNLPLAALDLALENWDRAEQRITLGLGPAAQPDPALAGALAAALGAGEPAEDES